MKNTVNKTEEETEQKIRVLNECVIELREKLRRFHVKYGKIIKESDEKYSEYSIEVTNNELGRS